MNIPYMFFTWIWGFEKPQSKLTFENEGDKSETQLNSTDNKLPDANIEIRNNNCIYIYL